MRKAYDFLNALLMMDAPSCYIEAMQEDGSLQTFLPELYELIDVPQSPVHHPEGCAYTHTLMVVDEAAKLRDSVSNPLAFMLTAVAHDFGKALTTTVSPDGRITAHNHAQAGEPLARAMTSRLTEDIPSRETLVNYVGVLTYHHMKGHLLLDMRPYKVGVLMETLDINDLILFSVADKKGRDTRYQDNSDALYARVAHIETSLLSYA